MRIEFDDISFDLTTCFLLRKNGNRENILRYEYYLELTVLDPTGYFCSWISETSSLDVSCRNFRIIYSNTITHFNGFIDKCFNLDNHDYQVTMFINKVDFYMEYKENQILKFKNNV